MTIIISKIRYRNNNGDKPWHSKQNYFFSNCHFFMEKVSRFPTWTFTFVTKFLPFHKVPKCGNF